LFAKHFTDPIFSGSHGASSPFVAGPVDIVEGRKLVKKYVHVILCDIFVKHENDSEELLQSLADFQGFDCS
jgi:hypothetical protein